MKPPLLLRIASILSILITAGHTLGGLSAWSPAGETEVLRAMRSFHFDALGASRSHLDFFLGFGFIISVYQFMQAVVLWQLASLAKADAPRVRPLIGSFMLASLASAALAGWYLFVIPVVFYTAIAACLGLAFYAAGKRKNAQPFAETSQSVSCINQKQT